MLAAEYPKQVEERYKVEVPEALKGRGSAQEPYGEEEFDEDGFPISAELSLMNEICRRRGWILPGKKLDYERAGRTILDDVRSGLIGHITLEKAGRDEE